MTLTKMFIKPCSTAKGESKRMFGTYIPTIETIIPITLNEATKLVLRMWSGVRVVRFALIAKKQCWTNFRHFHNGKRRIIDGIFYVQF